MIDIACILKDLADGKISKLDFKLRTRIERILFLGLDAVTSGKSEHRIFGLGPQEKLRLKNELHDGRFSPQEAEIVRDSLDIHDMLTRPNSADMYGENGVAGDLKELGRKLEKYVDMLTHVISNA